MSLHDDIMNLPCGELPPEVAPDDARLALEVGHKQARHAAAELANTVEAALDAARTALGELVRLKDVKERLERPEGWDIVGADADEYARLDNEYEDRKPAAWVAAREAYSMLCNLNQDRPVPVVFMQDRTAAARGLVFDALKRGETITYVDMKRD